MQQGSLGRGENTSGSNAGVPGSRPPSSRMGCTSLCRSGALSATAVPAGLQGPPNASARRRLRTRLGAPWPPSAPLRVGNVDLTYTLIFNSLSP